MGMGFFESELNNEIMLQSTLSFKEKAEVQGDVYEVSRPSQP